MAQYCLITSNQVSGSQRLDILHGASKALVIQKNNRKQGSTTWKRAILKREYTICCVNIYNIIFL